MMNFLRHLQRNQTLGKGSVIGMMETMAMTLTLQTLMMLMLYLLLMRKLMTKVL